MWREAKIARTSLKVAADAMNFDWATEYQPSVKMCKCNTDLKATAYTRSSQTLSTRLAILQHVLWAASAWRTAHRERCDMMGIALFERVGARLEVTAELVEQMWAGGLAFCTDVVGEECSHVKFDVVVGIGQPGVSPQQQVWTSMKELCRHLHSCGLAKHMLLCLLQMTVVSVERALDEDFKEIRPHKVELKVRSGCTNRRAPDTFRHFIMRTVRMKGRGQNGKSAMKLDGYHASRHAAWLQKEVSAYLFACRRTFTARGGTYGIWEDAARLGNPAKEHLVMLGVSMQDGHGCVLPPQVLSNMFCLFSSYRPSLAPLPSTRSPIPAPPRFRV